MASPVYFSSELLTPTTATIPSPHETTREYVNVESDGQKQQTIELVDKPVAGKTYKEDLEVALQKNPGLPEDEVRAKVLVDRYVAERETLKAHLETALQKNPGVPENEVRAKVLIDRYVAERENTLKDLPPQ